MATSSQVRAWWSGYQRNTAKYVKINFPGDGRTWSLWVADKSAPVWQAVAQIMESEPYLFRETAGGTYSAREPGSNSLHTYALALDLNPKKNPMKPPPLVYDYPETFIKRMEGIRANGKQAIMWGGRWPASNPPDTMHWQINVAPGDCVKVTWDKGSGNAPDPGDDDVEEVVKGIQRGLNAAGFKGSTGAVLTVDGQWGPNTEFAHTAMCKAAKVTSGGVTTTQLNAAIAAHAKVVPSSTIHPHRHDEGVTGPAAP
jgi:hypothetical protein